MQVNVDQIITSGINSGLFRLVTGDAPQEILPDQLPALIVYRRRFANGGAYTTNRRKYNGAWQYEVWIESEFCDGHAVVETLMTGFLLQLNTDEPDPWFEIVGDIIIDEGQHAERQIIAAQFTLSIPSHFDIDV
jgi:hypothetical protein